MFSYSHCDKVRIGSRPTCIHVFQRIFEPKVSPLYLVNSEKKINGKLLDWRQKVLFQTQKLLRSHIREVLIHLVFSDFAANIFILFVALFNMLFCYFCTIVSYIMIHFYCL